MNIFFRNHFPFTIPVKLVFVFSLIFCCNSIGAQQLYNDSTVNIPTAATSGATMDVIAVDANQDGDLDIVLANEFQRNRILFNDGFGHFADSTNGRLTNVSHDSEDIGTGDFNNDGWPDLVFVSEDDSTHEFYMNNGNGHFTDVSNRLPQSVANAVAVADLTGDGYDDILIGNAGQELFLVNDGTAHFTDETALRFPVDNTTTQDLKLCDIDGDSDLDLLIGNEDGNKIYINADSGYFSDETTMRLPLIADMETRKIEFGDANGDGFPDLFFSNVNFIPWKDPQDRLFFNDGNGYFSDTTAFLFPGESLSSLDGIFTDADGDGDQDIVAVYFPSQPYAIYLNNGSGLFTDMTATSFPANMSGNGLGVISADLNGDSLNDLYFCNRVGKDKLLIRIDPAAAVSENTMQTVSVFPNPCTDQFTLTGLPAGNYTLQISDMAGRKLQEYAGVFTNQIELDTGSFEPGIYLLLINSPEQNLAIRIQKA